MKKITQNLVKVSTALALGLMLNTPLPSSAMEVDGISGATIPMKKGSLSLKGDSLVSLIEYGGAGYLLSTVSEDGIPFAAPIDPKIDKDGNIRITSTYNKTRENLDISGKAMLTVYAINCGGDNMGMHLGGRLRLTRVGEQVSKSRIKSFGLRTIILHIEEELPLEEKEYKKTTAPYRR